MWQPAACKDLQKSPMDSVWQTAKIQVWQAAEIQVRQTAEIQVWQTAEIQVWQTVEMQKECNSNTDEMRISCAVAERFRESR